MQNLLNNEIFEEVRKAKIKRMEFILNNESVGGFVECPSCHYIGKNKRFTGKIFQNDGKKSFKCFNCGIWRAF